MTIVLVIEIERLRRVDQLTAAGARHTAGRDHRRPTSPQLLVPYSVARCLVVPLEPSDALATPRL